MGGLKLGKYQHYKGGLYEVVGVARHSETSEEMVIYRALYNLYSKTKVISQLLSSRNKQMT